MSINVIQLIQTVMTDDVTRQLADRLGLPADATGKVLAATGPAIVAGLMQKSASLEGARSLFTAILAPEVNSYIGEQLPQLLGSTGSLSQLEVAGRHLLERMLERRVDLLSDEVSRQTGVPAHATHAITGILGAVVLGLLKRQFLLGKGGVSQLPELIGQQLPIIAPYLNDRLLAAVGLGGLGAFTSNTLSQLKAVSAHIGQPTPSATLAPNVPSVVQVPADAVVPTRRRAYAWLWWTLAILAVVLAALAFLFQRGYEIEWSGFEWPAKHDVLTQGAVQAASEPEDVTTSAAASDPASDPATVAAKADAAGSASGASNVPGVGATSALAASGADAATAASQVRAAVARLTQESRLVFAVSASGKPTLSAILGSEAEKNRLVDQLSNRLGQYNFVPDFTVDTATKPAGWLAHLDSLIPLMTLPGAELTLDGSRVELGGTAANAKLGWLDKLKTLLGAPYQIDAFDIDQAMAEATDNFRSAIKGLLSPGGSCVAADVVKVLNLQVINFGSSSNEVPASAFENLRQSSKVLSACARNGKTARLEVAGYTDNLGSAQENLQLSKRRAQAVRDYLVNTGVPFGSLTAQGYGDTHPVASNETESGRFANRRIAFLTQP